MKGKANVFVNAHSIVKEKLEKEVFKVPIGMIHYADTPEEAENLAADALAKIRCCKDDDIPVGTDTEGSIKVLQLYFRIGKEEWAIVFQLNKIIKKAKEGDSFVTFKKIGKMEDLGIIVM